MFRMSSNGRSCRYRTSPNIFVSAGEYPWRYWGHMECPQELSGGSWYKHGRGWRVQGGLDIECGIVEKVPEGVILIVNSDACFKGGSMGGGHQIDNGWRSMEATRTVF